MTLETILFCSFMATVCGLVSYYVSSRVIINTQYTRQYSRRQYSSTKDFDVGDLFALGFWFVVGAISGFGGGFGITYLLHLYGSGVFLIPLVSGTPIALYGGRNKLLSGAKFLLESVKGFRNRQPKELSVAELESLLEEMRQIEELKGETI